MASLEGLELHTLATFDLEEVAQAVVNQRDPSEVLDFVLRVDVLVAECEFTKWLIESLQIALDEEDE